MTRDELITRYKAGERDFRGANLASAVLRGEDLRRADLQSANLRGANLTGADLQSANLRGANLTGADLTGADLRRAYLTGADLAGADLTGANLENAYLWRADLRGACLTRADLRDAYLTRADLTGIVVDWPVGWSTDTVVRCRSCGCGETEAGYTDARVVLASLVGDTVYIIHEGNCWPLTVSLAEAEEMRQEVER